MWLSKENFFSVSYRWKKKGPLSKFQCHSPRKYWYWHSRWRHFSISFKSAVINVLIFHSVDWDIMNIGRRTPALTSCFTSHCYFFFLSLFLFAGYICEYQYYFPVGGKLHWMVARLQEERLLSWLEKLFSILSLNQRACECVPESH